MQAALIHSYKQKELELTSVPIPDINSNDVLVKIIAASINPLDLRTMAGGLKMLLHYDMPLILGNDFAGEVVAVGSKVTQFKVGDEVFGRPRKDRIGTFAEYIAVNTEDIALKPKNLTFQEAAAIPLVGLTSYQALHDLMDLKPGKKVLIQAGSGGVGSIAIQIAKQLGAFVATTTSSKNVEFVKSLGADQIIDYHKENFANVLTDYDAVFDTLGDKNLEQSFKIVKPSGKIVSVSGLPDAKFGKSYGLPYWKQFLLKVATRNLSKLEKETQVQYNFLFMKPSGKQLSLLTEWIEKDQVRPIIDRVFDLNDINDALNYSRSGHAKGKIIININ
ncbi:NADP-dependent oxidoreductase [Companilactobacillus sp. HBUAS59699]|uniref:NADP-dependent oxidoreductase n=1 Tax=Companilactobacillus sp. HBUAS59699 TaxID=3109358 RepID=UPI002FEFA508